MDAWQVLAGIGVGFCIGLVAVAMLRLPAPGVARPLVGFLVCAVLWALGDSLATLARSQPQKLAGLALLYTGAIYLPPFWWIAARHWARDRGVPTLAGRGWTWAPLLWATLMWGAMITNPWHGLFMTPVIGGRNVYQPLWWCMAVPNYLLIVGVLAVELHVARRVRLPEVRRQAGFLIAASLVMLGANAVWVSGARVPNETLLALSASSVLLFVGMVREGVFGVLPVALRILAEEDPDGLVVLRQGGRVAYLNARAREILAPFGVALEARLPEAFAGIAWKPDGSPLGSAPGWEEAWWQEVTGRHGALLSLGGRDTRWLQMSAQRVHGRRGRVRATCLRLRDVTAERRAEMQLRRARRLESVAQLALGVGHDFQNVLAIVRGNAELLLDDHPADPSIQRKAARIREAGRRAWELAEQLQIYAGGSAPVRTRLDLSALAHELVDLLQPDLPAEVRLRLELADDALPVAADPTQLRQILLNMLINAREALPEAGGAISVSTGVHRIDPGRLENLIVGRGQAPGEYAYVRVADTGGGMDPATQERLFEPYFSTKGKHRGVGLSSTLGIVRAHGALLQLETREGEGSEFRLHLRLQRDDADA